MGDGERADPSPEWLTTRAAILAALEPYPEAREAVARAVRARP